MAHRIQKHDLDPPLEVFNAYCSHTSSPTIILTVAGSDVEFLCDSGATRSCLNVLPPKVRLSRDAISIRSANGELDRSRLTIPAAVTDPVTGLTTTQSLVYAPNCPMNLLGRDIMFALNIAVGPSEGSFQPIRRALDVLLGESEGPIQPFYFYTLDLDESNGRGDSVVKYSNHKQSQVLGPRPKTRRPEQIHVTMKYVHDFFPEKDTYLPKLKECGCLKLHITHLLFDKQGHSCGLLRLPQCVDNLFQGVFPHVSLTCPEKAFWTENAFMAKEGAKQTDWTPLTEHPEVLYSAASGLYQTQMLATFLAEGVFHDIDGDMESDFFHVND